MTDTTSAAITPTTVEALVRQRMAASLGGRRGMLEGLIPGVVFTVVWMISDNLQTSLIASGTIAVGSVIVRLVQRQTLQYAGNAAFGIAIGLVFIRLADSGGGSQDDQALAFFLPGILWTAGYTVLLIISCVTRWPMFGFLVGMGEEDQLAWRQQPQIVSLCSKLTWVFMAPGAFGVLTQGPIWLLGWRGTIDPETAVAIIAVLRLGVGWGVRALAFGAMFWLLGRNATPLQADPQRPPAE